MIATKNYARKLSGMLRRGEACIHGVVLDEGLRYWIITDYIQRLTLHVLCDDRPSWIKYAPAEFRR